ncbi:hypothetical protein [Streptomyces sp. MP131-18]|uniref:hypothetical protein n=1 Tax=Streptomyces sp. MP131-18 TaxID=1857892 RepID=UPI00209A9811|nr:hypothetical protein [Streptomyces sp. MP131-18]
MGSEPTMQVPSEVIVAALRDAWREPGAGQPLYGSGPPLRPIAESEEDQLIPSGGSSPLWEIVRWMPAEPDGQALSPTSLSEAFARPLAFRLDVLGASRHALATRFTWSIISPGDVAWVVAQLEGRAVVEIGAGTGYWAWQLQQAGVDVAAYDPHSPGEDNRYCTAGPYTTVLVEDASAVKRHPDRALLMVWPPLGGEHARHALSVYEGDLLLYAGEGLGGCTADDAFYKMLNAEWELTSVAPRHVTWSGIHCELAAYRRKRGEHRG